MTVFMDNEWPNVAGGTQPGSDKYDDTENSIRFDVLAHSGLGQASKIWTERSQNSKESQSKNDESQSQTDAPGVKRRKRKKGRKRRYRHYEIVDGERPLRHKKAKNTIDGPPMPQYSELNDAVVNSKDGTPAKSLGDKGSAQKSPEIQDAAIFSNERKLGIDGQLLSSVTKFHIPPDIDRLLKDLQAKLSDSQDEHAKTRLEKTIYNFPLITYMKK